jgi:hypothetical protein
MRKTALATLVAVGFGLAGAGGASAAPANGAAIAELGHLADQLIQVVKAADSARTDVLDTASPDADLAGSSPIGRRPAGLAR